MNLEELIPKHEKREKIYKRFYELFKTNSELNSEIIQKKALNLEIAIFNYSIKFYRNNLQDINTNYWNILFETVYYNRCKTIYSNLNPNSVIKNETLIDDFLTNKFTEHQLAHFTPEELFYTKFHKLQTEYDLYPKELERINPEDIPDSVYKCKNCNSYKTSYYTQQCRSADEPESVFVKCLLCGKQWKF